MMVERVPPILETYRGRRILERLPWVMPGEAIIGNGQVNHQLRTPPQAAAPVAGEIILPAYTHDLEMPVEIQDMALDVTTFGNTTAAPQFSLLADQMLYLDGVNLLNAHIVLQVVRDEDRAQDFIRQPYRAAIAFDPETEIWQLDRPYTIEQGQGISIIVQNLGANFTMRVSGGEVPVFFTGVGARVAITLFGERLRLGDEV